MKDKNKTKGHLIGELAELRQRITESEGTESARKRMERKLRESEERYKSLYVRTPAMLHSLDATNKLVEVSDHWLEVLGYERSEVIGRSPRKFMTGESWQYAQTVTLPEFMKMGYARDIEYQFVKKNGEIIDILLSGVAEYGEDGNFIRSLGVLTDITERKKGEKELKESEERLRRLYEAAFEGIYISKDGCLLDGNEQLAEMLGYELSDVDRN